jgi:hypothetical protein
MTPEENPLSHLSVEEIKAMLGTHIVPTPEVVSNNGDDEILADVPVNFSWDE